MELRSIVAAVGLGALLVIVGTAAWRLRPTPITPPTQPEPVADEAEHPPPAPPVVIGKEPAEPSEFQETPSGLRYADLRVGEGEQATAGQVARVRYAMWTDDKQPLAGAGKELRFVIGTGEVLQGWDEGVIGMREGGVRQLRFPPALGFGSRERDGAPPDSSLIAELDLIELGAVRVPPEAPTTVAEDAWQELPSGVLWAEVTPGAGEPIQPGEIVALELTGWSIRGQRFDSTLARNAPMQVAIGEGRMLHGIELGIAGIKAGETRQLKVPSEHAFRERGRPPYVAGAEPVTFEVQIVRRIEQPPPP